MGKTDLEDFKVSFTARGRRVNMSAERTQAYYIYLLKTVYNVDPTVGIDLLGQQWSTDSDDEV
jgi:hypothetical protein